MSGTVPSDREIATNRPPLLSIIIPAYNEEQRLADSLRQIMAYCDIQDYASEIIVVDDGSADRTPEIVEELMRTQPNLQLVRAAHGGKGHACKQGILAGQGQWLFLCDADLSMPIEEISKFIPLFQEDYQIIIASREMPGARRHGEPYYRHLMGRIFNFLVRLLAVPGIQDTQCGFKCFRSDVTEDIFGKQTINGWGFDVEILFVAQKRGYQIAEIPINWYYQRHSKVRPFRDAINMFREVFRIRLNDWRNYYKKECQRSSGLLGEN